MKAEPVSVLGQMEEKPFFMLCLGVDFSDRLTQGALLEVCIFAQHFETAFKC